MQKKKIRLEIRLSEEEARVFQNKAESYGGNVSAMVRDAVRRFDDKRTRGKIETMEALLQFYKKYQQQLSWLGGNFNQCMHRANELAIAGELHELFPQHPNPRDSKCYPSYKKHQGRVGCHPRQARRSINCKHKPLGHKNDHHYPALFR